MNRLQLYFLVVLLPFLWSQCKTNHGYTSKPTKNTAGLDHDLPEINTIAYHINDSVSEVYLEVKNDKLLYKRTDTTNVFYANLKIIYRLLNEQGAKKILDSSSFYFSDPSREEFVKSKSLISKFAIKAKRNNNYHLEIETIDLNKKTRYTSSLNINKQSLFSKQNFLTTVRDTIIFNNYYLPASNVKISFTNKSIKQSMVQCFKKEFGPALPPFSTKETDALKYKPDSSYILYSNNNAFFVKMPQEGFYNLTFSDKPGDGIALYAYDKSFPGVGSSADMIKSCRYIMERSEYDNCLNADDQKAAIDKFWLNIGGSNERARELLKRYYSRVREANEFYSSYTHGWKSDRGMIYIVFGPPTNIYKSKRDEIWVYGNEANPAALRFIFNKTENPFTDNDFILERSLFFKEAWYTAVEYWRQGNIYMDAKR